MTPPINLPVGFSLVNTFGSTTLAPGASTTFEVRLDATTAGVFNGELFFGNDDPDENPYNFTISGTVNAPKPKYIYLPLVRKGFVYAAPDLVVDNLVAASSAVTVTIRNQGNASVTDAFWVDVYFNPSVIPSLNQEWHTIASHGVVWGVTTPIPAGGSLVLTTGGDYYSPEHSSGGPLPGGADVYALVDSINHDTTYGAVLEGDEGNNLFGPVVSTAGVAGAAAPTGNQGRAMSKEGLPLR